MNSPKPMAAKASITVHSADLLQAEHRLHRHGDRRRVDDLAEDVLHPNPERGTSAGSGRRGRRRRARGCRSEGPPANRWRRQQRGQRCRRRAPGDGGDDEAGAPMVVALRRPRTPIRVGDPRAVDGRVLERAMPTPKRARKRVSAFTARRSTPPWRPRTRGWQNTDIPGRLPPVGQPPSWGPPSRGRTRRRRRDEDHDAAADVEGVADVGGEHAEGGAPSCSSVPAAAGPRRVRRRRPRGPGAGSARVADAERRSAKRTLALGLLGLARASAVGTASASGRRRAAEVSAAAPSLTFAAPTCRCSPVLVMAGQNFVLTSSGNQVQNGTVPSLSGQGAPGRVGRCRRGRPVRRGRVPGTCWNEPPWKRLNRW